MTTRRQYGKGGNWENAKNKNENIKMLEEYIENMRIMFISYSFRS